MFLIRLVSTKSNTISRNRFLADIVLPDDSHFMARSTYDWRSKLHRLVTSATKNSIHQGYYLALIFGDRSKLAFEDWARLKHSGLSHLVAISGLHIGIAFAVGYLVGRGALLVLTLLLPTELRYKTTKLRLLLGIFTGLVLAFFLCGFRWVCYANSSRSTHACHCQFA